jgi:hypothetical protein
VLLPAVFMSGSPYVESGRRIRLNHQGHERRAAAKSSSNAIVVPTSLDRSLPPPGVAPKRSRRPPHVR